MRRQSDDDDVVVALPGMSDMQRFRHVNTQTDLLRLQKEFMRSKQRPSATVCRVSSGGKAKKVCVCARCH